MFVENLFDALQSSELDGYYGNFTNNNIYTTKDLSLVSMKDYSNYGIRTLEDKKKLFGLIQRLKKTGSSSFLLNQKSTTSAGLSTLAPVSMLNSSITPITENKDPNYNMFNTHSESIVLKSVASGTSHKAQQLINLSKSNNSHRNYTSTLSNSIIPSTASTLSFQSNLQAPSTQRRLTLNSSNIQQPSEFGTRLLNIPKTFVEQRPINTIDYPHEPLTSYSMVNLSLIQKPGQSLGSRDLNSKTSYFNVDSAYTREPITLGTVRKLQKLSPPPNGPTYSTNFINTTGNNNNVLGITRDLSNRLSLDNVPSPSEVPCVFKMPEITTMESGIYVCVRKRPLKQHRTTSGKSSLNTTRRLSYGASNTVSEDKDIAAVDNQTNQISVYGVKYSVDMTPSTSPHHFKFDAVFDETAKNQEIYDTIAKKLVDKVFFHEKNVSILAYGQTGSGKTHTMMGDKREEGLCIKASRELFNLIAQASHLQISEQLEKHKNKAIFISFYEIYCGGLYDLLNNRTKLVPLEDSKSNTIIITRLMEKQVNSHEAMVEMIQYGLKNRMIGVTGQNADSSRSHAILQITIKKKIARKSPSHQHPTLMQRDRDNNSMSDGKGNNNNNNNNSGWTVKGKFSFIDLAGSERGVDTIETNKQTRIEGSEINQSLLALKECIRSISFNNNGGGSGTNSRTKHTPFRQSKLTLVLRDCLVGDGITWLMATIHPGSNQVEDTLNTLRYANRIKEFKVVSPISPNTISQTNPHSTQSIVSDEDTTRQIQDQLFHGHQFTDAADFFDSSPTLLRSAHANNPITNLNFKNYKSTPDLVKKNTHNHVWNNLLDSYALHIDHKRKLLAYEETLKNNINDALLVSRSGSISSNTSREFISQAKDILAQYKTHIANFESSLAEFTP